MLKRTGKNSKGFVIGVSPVGHLRAHGSRRFMDLSCARDPRAILKSQMANIGQFLADWEAGCDINCCVGRSNQSRQVRD